MEKERSQIEKAALFVIEQCRKEGIVVHRHNAKSSGSIYLKFDWGMAHSLRISDHKGIEKYHYRFNLIQGIRDIIRVSHKNKNHSNTYPFREIYVCIEDIFRNRQKMIEKNEGMELYLMEMNKIREKIERLPKEKLYPFWKYGKRVA